MLPEKAILKSQQEAAKAELFIVLGSSLRVSPANYFPLDAKENGAKLVIVNMERTDFDHLADMVINNRFISEVLQELEQEAWGRFSRLTLSKIAKNRHQFDGGSSNTYLPVS
jgi:NAD-dependent deacetylase